MIDELKDKFPFLSFGTYLDEEYVGIIQNSDCNVVTIYLLNLIHDKELRKIFLELGNEWWWESNRTIPINIFIKDRFKPFKPYLKTFSKKEFKLIYGHEINLTEGKKSKKRTIHLNYKSF